MGKESVRTALWRKLSASTPIRWLQRRRRKRKQRRRGSSRKESSQNLQRSSRLFHVPSSPLSSKPCSTTGPKAKTPPSLKQAPNLPDLPTAERETPGRSPKRTLIVR